MTTLTLLLSVLRLHLPQAHAAALEQHVFQPGNVILGLQPQPRLQLRDRDRDFFRSRVQDRAGIEHLVEGQTPNAATDAQRNLTTNARALDVDLAEVAEQTRLALVTFVLTRTFLVVVTTPTLESAHRIFSVLNDRGRPLTYTDSLKAEFLGHLPEHLHDKVAERWEGAEETLGRSAFEDLFTHYRMIRVQAKAQKTNLVEFREGVLARTADRGQLLDELLGPYTEAYQQILGSSYVAPAGAEGVNTTLRWLRQLDNDDWQPPGLEAVRRWGATDTPRLAAFLRRLERLAASMFIRRVDVTRRIRRCGEVLAALDAPADPSPLELTEVEQRQTLAELDGPLYLSQRTRLPVLLRLDEALAGQSGMSFTPRYQTVEHVLPQHPAQGCQWRDDFTPEQHEHWQHRLGNLAVLTRAKNSQAQHDDFDVKKEKYFSSKNGVSTYASASQVLAEQAWTPAVLQRRQRANLAVLAELWDLSPESPDPGGKAQADGVPAPAVGV